MRSVPSGRCAKMLTGHTSASFFATAGSRAAASSTRTSMKVPAMLLALREAPADQLGDVLDALRHRDARALHALDLGCRGVLAALDDRAGVAEAHALHLVHEAARHEGDHGQPAAMRRH